MRAIGSSGVHGAVRLAGVTGGAGVLVPRASALADVAK